ncbi:hypothetical protein CFP56_002861 [Quercus suber]|uniref:Uncharacterized protein n=1 Tax=Quercus suber TaxID=58331 RepID=A0AAW0LE94_QUESU
MEVGDGGDDTVEMEEGPGITLPRAHPLFMCFQPLFENHDRQGPNGEANQDPWLKSTFSLSFTFQSNRWTKPATVGCIVNIAIDAPRNPLLPLPNGLHRFDAH